MNESQEHYTVLARRFRPNTFDEVIGQDHVAQALRNAIRSGRVAHAYLFTGARGVGKTSMARILAKALNCPEASDGIPCNQCDICRQISTGKDIDVLEIDGASNRGIDDVRSLRSNVNVKSMHSAHKIYIIDEVHMLTKEAFNALLKTLEEPPSNVMFVFCTTEPNKLPDTILSRCQRFDFGTIATTNIASRLKQIAQAEGRVVTDAALEMVARRAAGSMRDSQSLFDQLLAFGEENIAETDVHRLLGTASDERLLEIVSALAERHQGAALESFAAALDEGVQLSELTDQLLAVFRDLMVIGAGANKVDLLSMSESSRDALKLLADRWGIQTTLACLQILADAKGRMQRTTFGRALAELALVRIAMLEDLENISHIVQAIGQQTGTESAIQARPVERPAREEAPREPISSSKPPAPESPDAPEKKSEPNHESSQIEPENVESYAARIQFEAGAEDEILSQIISGVDDMLGSQIKQVKKAAISGPNRLDLAFSKSYSFLKRSCERREVTDQLTKLLSEITGKQVELTFSLLDDEPVPERSQETISDRKTASQPLRDGDEDEFVRQVKDLFGASVERVVPIQSTDSSAGKE